jgi:hypothetical protein
VDYFHFAFATATAFSPTDISAVKGWAKLMMMAEGAISLVVHRRSARREHLEVIGTLTDAGRRWPTSRRNGSCRP